MKLLIDSDDNRRILLLKRSYNSPSNKRNYFNSLKKEVTIPMANRTKSAV